MNIFLILSCVIYFVITIVISKIISEKGLKKLTDEDKIKVLNAFSNFRKYQMIPILIIFVAFIFIIFLYPEYVSKSRYFILISIAVYFIILVLLYFWKIKKMNMPKEYNAYVYISNIIMLSGFLVFISSILLF